MMKALTLILYTATTLALNTICYAGTVDVVGSFSSPLTHPRFGLDFDTSTGTLWGIDNLRSSPNIMNFDLSGNRIQSFTGESSFNSTGITVDPDGQRIYYWQNLGRYLHQTSYPNGAFLGTTGFPLGYQSAVSVIDYDSDLDRIVMAKTRVFSPSQGIDIRPGFDYVIPGSGVDFSVELDVFRVGDLSHILGFVMTQDNYWLLGPNSLLKHDQIVEIDRTTGQLVDRFILPDSIGQIYRGLAYDPSTGLFYANFSDQGVRVLELTPVPVPSAVWLFGSGLIGLIVMKKNKSKISVIPA
jgi:DNA-binding beta-propeller fold protein YncE